MAAARRLPLGRGLLQVRGKPGRLPAPEVPEPQAGGYMGDHGSPPKHACQYT